MKKGQKCSEETIEKMKKSQKGIPKSEEHKKKLSESIKKIHPDYWLGKHHTEETKLKISISRKEIPSNRKGIKHSKETCDKISKSLIGNKRRLGKKYSIESREKMSKSHLGKIPWNKGKKNIHSKEGIERLSFLNSGIHSHFYGRPPPKNSRKYNGDWYDSPLQGTIWIRSGWEILYAEYLDQHNILWYYEPMTFSLTININGAEKQTTYTPDFFFPIQNKFIEIKGRKNYEHWEDCESKLKFKKFKEEYSYFIEVLFYEELIKLNIKL